MKQFWQSKRFWAGIIGVLTAVQFIALGEKTWTDQLPIIIMAAIGVIQSILGITTNDSVYVGSKKLGK